MTERFREEPYPLVDGTIDTVEYQWLPYDQQGVVGTHHGCIGRQDLLAVPVDRGDIPFALEDGADMPVGIGAAERHLDLHNLPVPQSDILCNKRYIGELVIEVCRHQLIGIDIGNILDIFSDLLVVPQIEQCDVYLGVEHLDVFERIERILSLLHDDKDMGKLHILHDMLHPGIGGGIGMDQCDVLSQFFRGGIAFVAGDEVSVVCDPFAPYPLDKVSGDTAVGKDKYIFQIISPIHILWYNHTNL